MIGIGINVDSRQVVDAKKQIEMLNQSMNDTNELGDLTIGAGASQEVKKLAQEIQRLKQIANQGDKNGGILNRQQFQDAQRMMTLINQGVQNYARQLASVRDEYKKINQEQKALNALKYGGTATPGDLQKFNQNKQRMTELAEERKMLERQKQQMTSLGASATDSANRIGGMSEAEAKKRGFDFNQLASKTAAMAVAAIGAGSIIGFISKSRSLYGQAAGHEAALAGKGVTGGYGGSAGLGYGPVDYMSIMEQMAGTGVHAKHVGDSTRFAAAFARRNGMDASQVSSLYGTMYGASGQAQNATSVLAMAVEKGVKKIKMPELLTMIARNTNATAQAMGGSRVSREQIAADANLAILANNLGDNVSYKQFMKSEKFGNFMQNGLKSAGTPMGEIMLNELVGMYDDKDGKGFNWEKIHDINLIRQGGFKAHPELLGKLIGKLSGTDKAKAGQLETFMSEAGIKGAPADDLISFTQSPTYLEFMKRGKTMKNLQAGSDEEKKFAAQFEKDFSTMTGAAKIMTEAEWQAEQLRLGAKMFQATANIEKAMIDFTHSLIGSGAFALLCKTVSDIGKDIADVAKFFRKFTDGKVDKDTAKNALEAAPTILSHISPVAKITKLQKDWILKNFPELGKFGEKIWDGAFDGMWQKLIGVGEAGAADLPVTFGGARKSGGVDFAAESKAKQGRKAIRVIGRTGRTTRLEMSDGSIVDRTGNLNETNFNRGNIVYGDFARRMGAIGKTYDKDKNTVAVFPNEETGVKALKELLFNSGTYKDRLLSDVPRKINGKSYQTGNPVHWYNNVQSVAKVENKHMRDYTTAEQDKIVQGIKSAEGGKGVIEKIVSAAKVENVIDLLTDYLNGQIYGKTDILSTTH